MADTSPQLVSAVSISQDVAANGAVAERADERSKTDDRLENGPQPAAKEDADAVQKESTDSILTRKGRSAMLVDAAGAASTRYSRTTIARE